MIRGISIYTSKETIISPDEIQAQMRARAIPVDWVATFSDQPDRTLGYFVPEGRADNGSSIGISSGTVGPHEKAELLEVYGDTLTSGQREALAAAKTRYQITSLWSPDAEWDRACLNLVRILAEPTNSLILDSARDDRLYNLVEYLELFD